MEEEFNCNINSAIAAQIKVLKYIHKIYINKKKAINIYNIYILQAGMTR